MKKTVYIFILFIIFGNAYAKKINTSTLKETTTHVPTSKQGSIQIKLSKDNLETKKISFHLKDNKMAGDLIVYHDHIYDDHIYKDVIRGRFVLDNFSDQKKLVYYEILFKDVKGLVAKASGHFHLPLGTRHAIQCGNIPLPTHDIQNIIEYELKFKFKS